VGRGAVRAAIASTIQAAEINYVGSVFPARPVIVEEEQYLITMANMVIQASASGSSAVIVVNLPGEDKRERIALVGRGAVCDFDKHPIVLEIFFACEGGDGIAAQQDYDSIIDALVPLIRNNPNMGVPSAVWSAGEYSAGVTHEQEQPYTTEDGLTILMNGQVRFEAWEQITGSGV
jgi:hypothetical protein